MKQILIGLLVVGMLASCNMLDRKRDGYRPDEYFYNEELPIAEAIYNGKQKELKALIDGGAEINHVGKEGFTYLMYAIMIEDYKITECLLENGADPNQLSPLMKTKRNKVREESEKMPLNMLPLETCCGSSYPMKYLELLVKHGADLNDTRAELPVYAAIMSDDMKKIEFLLKNGADINQQDRRGGTFLMSAANTMNWHVVDYLLDCGADVFLVDRNGYTLGLKLQEYINRDVWTPEGQARLQGLIDRLKAKGVVFPVRKQTPPTAN